jgi:hypothetical protein
MWVDDFNRAYQRDFRDLWLSTPRLAPVVRVSAKEGRLAWQVQLTELRGFQLGQPPDFPSESDATLRFAASAIEEHLTAAVGERLLGGEEIARLMNESFGQQVDREDLDLSVRFAARPCRVEISGGQLRCLLHFTEFHSGGSSYPPLSVELNYKFELRGGGLALVRLAAPKVTFAKVEGDDGPLTGRQQTLRVGAQRKLDRVLGEELVWSRIRLPLAAGKPQRFEVAELLADKNWLQMGLKQDSTSAQQP